MSRIGADDAWLIREGRHECVWRLLGAHLHTLAGTDGVAFAVWAPNAERVALVGDFNHYDANTHAMTRHDATGIWELFVPGIGVGARYRFDVVGADHVRRQKADPYARAMLAPSDSVAVVTDSRFHWTDAAWLLSRARSHAHTPVSVYEVHAGSFGAGVGGGVPDYAGLANILLDHVVGAGFTHIQFMPLSEHPFTGSWGYQPIGLYAPTCRYGDADALRSLVDTAHGRGIGVLLDWVPAHFPADDHGLQRFDGTALYEHEDPRLGVHPDWGTLIFNYARAEVVNYLVSNALYWIEEFHMDGLRVDAVASMLYLDYSRKPGEWLPNRNGGRENLPAVTLLQRLNQAIHSRHPGVMTIAEESTAWPGVTRPVADGGLGFTLKWNMGWMHDTLSYFGREPIHRRHHHNEMTFSMVYAYSERFVLPLSHDEVVHGKGSLVRKMPGDRWRQFANLRLLLALMWAHPGRKHLFMGGEIGQPTEWNHDGFIPFDLLSQADHAGVLHLVQDLNRLYRALPALHQADDEPAGFHWLRADDAVHSSLVFCRSASGAPDVVVVVNLTPVVRHDFTLPLPGPGTFREILNTDSAYYAGSNVGNPGSHAARLDRSGHSLQIVLPPLAVVYFERQAA
jgi:1,4-alpha-glucan branching enzyme